MPSSDALLSRDVLVHFDFASIWRFFANWYLSEIPYLITTHFNNRGDNTDIQMGQWRPLDLCAAPFYLPKPQQVIDEKCTESQGRYADKTLSVWSRQQLAEFFDASLNPAWVAALKHQQEVRKTLESQRSLITEARTALEKGQPDLARNLLISELSSLSFDFEANHLLGVALALLKEIPLAIDYLRRAAGLNPQDEKVLFNLLRLGLQYQKPQLVEVFLPLYRQQVESDALVEKAQAYLQRQSQDTAVRSQTIQI